MELVRIELRNWKSYPEAEFRFPTPTADKHVVLIGAMNGSGKTSLLEALLVGTYGPDGHSKLVRKRRPTGTRETEVDKPYNEFLLSAFNSSARAAGQSRMEVRTTWRVPEHELAPILRIRRSWTLRGRSIEEELVVEEGQSEMSLDIVQPPAMDALASDKTYYRNFIARRLLPHSMAGYYFFDGEKLEHMVEGSLHTQLLQAIGEFFGIGLFEKAEDVLKDILLARKNLYGTQGDSTSRFEQALAKLQVEAAEYGRRHAELEEEMARVREAELEIEEELGRLTKATGRRPREIREELTIKKEKHRSLMLELAKIAELELPLALATTELRRSLLQKLQADEVLEKWQLEQASGSRTREAFLAELRREQPLTVPPLTDTQRKGLVDWVERVWIQLYHPRPQDSPSEPFHGYLSPAQRASLLARLPNLGTRASSSLESVFDRIRLSSEVIAGLERDLAEFGGVEDTTYSQELVLRNQEVNARTAKIAQELGSVRNDIQRCENETSEIRRKLNRQVSIDKDRKVDEKRQLLARAEVLRERTSLARRQLQDHYRRRLAEAVEDIYCNLAHKGESTSVKFTEDSLELLDATGRDLRKHDPSKGELQIFGMAVVGALHRVSTRKAPIVIDTPLGRLDSDHRMRLVSWVTQNTGSQVIFLSTDEEVVGDKKRELDRYIATTFRVDFKDQQSVVRPGEYFE